MKPIIKGLLLIAVCAAQLAWAGDPLDTWTTNTVAQGVNLAGASFPNGLCFTIDGMLQITAGGVTWTTRVSASTVVTNVTINTNGLAELGDSTTRSDSGRVADWKSATQQVGKPAPRAGRSPRGRVDRPGHRPWAPMETRFEPEFAVAS